MNSRSTSRKLLRQDDNNFLFVKIHESKSKVSVKQKLFLFSFGNNRQEQKIHIPTVFFLSLLQLLQLLTTKASCATKLAAMMTGATMIRCFSFEGSYAGSTAIPTIASYTIMPSFFTKHFLWSVASCSFNYSSIPTSVVTFKIKTRGPDFVMCYVVRVFNLIVRKMSICIQPSKTVVYEM